MRRHLLVAILAAASTVGGSWLVPAPAAAGRPAAPPIAGNWAQTERCASSSSQMRFTGNALVLFVDGERAAEYEVEITDTPDRVTVRVLAVIQPLAAPGGMAEGWTLQYRRDAEGLRLVGIGRPGGQLVSPTVATLYRRCS